MLIVERVGAWLEDSDLESTSLVRYVYSLGLLVTSGIESTEQLTRVNMRRYMMERRASGISANTVNKDLAAVLSFAKWLEPLGEFELNRLHELRTLFQRPDPIDTPDWLTPEHYVRLREACGQVNPVLELALVLAVHTGMRLGELRRVTYESFFLEREHAFAIVQDSKRKRLRPQRSTPISRACADELLEKGFASRTGLVFPARQRKGEELRAPFVAESTMERWLWDAQEIAGLDVRWTTCRHTYATWLIREGLSLALVAQAMGNSPSICFRHYAAHIPGGNAEFERGFGALAKLEGQRKIV